MSSDFPGNQLSDLNVATPFSDTDPVSTGAPALRQIKRYLVETQPVELENVVRQDVPPVELNALSVNEVAGEKKRIETPVTVDPSTGDITTPGNIEAGSFTIDGHTLPTTQASCLADGFATGTNAPLNGVGIDTIQRTGVGRYTVTLSRSAPNVNYMIIGSVQGDTSVDPGNYNGNFVSQVVNVDTFKVITQIADNRYDTDADFSLVVIY